jgi:hypothetical protein
LIGSAARAGPNVSQQNAMAMAAATVRTTFNMDIPRRIVLLTPPLQGGSEEE